MAVFNPNVPAGQDNMPNWQKTSAPISDLTPDKSTGLALNTIAGGIEGGANLAETTAKGIINEDIRNTVEPVREEFTQQLEAVANGQRSIIPAPVQTPQGSVTMSLAPEDQPQAALPAAIDTGISKVQGLQSALVNGKINDTYYDARLKEAVTGLRSRYPGFVDYIDQRVAQITGVNPANAYVQNLMQDINRAQSTKRTETDRAVDDAMKSGYPNSDAMVKRLQEVGPDFLPAFRQWYSEQTMLDAKIKRNEALRQSTRATKEDIATQRTEDFTNEVGSTVSSNFSAMVKIAGVDTPQGIQDAVAKMAANPEQYTDAQAKQLATQILAQKSILENQLRARARSTAQDQSGRSYSYASDIGTGKVESIIKDQLSVYDSIYKALWDGGAGGAGIAFAHANHAMARLADTKDNLLSGPMGDWTAKVATMNDLMGPNWTGLIIQQGLKQDIDTKMRALLTERQIDARIQTGFDKTGKPITLKQHMEEADSLQSQQKIDARMKSRYFNNLVNIVDDIKDKNAPDADKVNVIRYLFSPQGQGILSHISQDYTDPNTGRFVPGRYSVFSRLTAPDVVSEVSRLAKGNPELGQMYKNYMEREAGAQLFYKDLLNLNRYTGHDDLHFKYNDGANGGVPRVELIGRDGKPPMIRPPVPGQWNTNRPETDPGYLYQINQTVERVNTALAGMARVENGLGGNANEYLLQFLMRSQVDLGKNWEGLPAKLVDAIAASRAPAKRIEDTFKNLGNNR